MAYQKSLNPSYILLLVASAVAGAIGFVILGRQAGTKLPVPTLNALIILGFGLVIVLLLLWAVARSGGRGLPSGAVPIALLVVAGTIMFLGTAYQFAAYISLPVDLLSFSESPFVDRILRLRMGEPLYAPPQDNVTYPYNPGAEVLTYTISAVFGQGNSIPFYRVVQLSYVLLAAVVATGVCDLLARGLLSDEAYRNRPVWRMVWFLFLFLVTVDPRFNLYNHSLHNDGLALLVSIIAYWLMVRHATAPQGWLLGAMALLPTLGFLVKQSLLFWIALFSLYLLVAGGISWRKLLLFVLVSVGAAAVATGMGYALWGDDYWFWVFEALRKKQVSLLRDIRNLFDAGIYALMGLFGGWEFVLRDTRKKTATLWGVWLLLFANEVYTSGFAFQRNHLGPGILIGACWFFVALVKIWPTRESAQAWWQYKAQEAVVVVGVILVFGALGLAREPLDPVPDDFDRYVADIEREFEGLDPAKVLMDTGTWIYLRENVLMKDRSAPLSVHTGANQSEISHEMLTETIERIEAQTYDKILARQLDTGDTWYDFQDRGSGVKTAILETYHVVRRIPGVRGIGQWWPNHLVAEVLVLAPNND